MDKKAEVIKRLYLTEEQLKEVSEMWPDEQEHPLVVELKMWRSLFDEKDIQRLVSSSDIPDSVKRAILHKLYRFELTIAVHFWEITGWKAVFVGQKSENDEAIKACQVLERTSQDMLARIKEVLDEME